MTNSTPFTVPENLTLGKTVSYIEHYSPSLLQGVPRQLSRDSIAVTDPLPFVGVDIWNGYELSWLNNKGKPMVAIMQCEVPITSPNLIESKSFKLYLNSFNQSKFDHPQAVSDHLEHDLSQCAGQAVKVKLFLPNEFEQLTLGALEGTVIDDLDIEITNYQPSVTLLKTGHKNVSETLVSHLLKSNCLITSQPDWASIQIRYEGKQIEHESLLAYLISFRQHNEFHEQCVERIYCDLMRYCQPSKLSVYARYTRRGGLDINPIRSSDAQAITNVRLARQ